MLLMMAALTSACSADPSPRTEIDGDQGVLLKARDALVGDAELNWASAVELSEWDGVTVDGESGRVVGLSLRSRDLNGYIPALLGRLSSLRVLSLSGNQLSGEIPKSLGDLVELETLALSNNELSGSIPKEFGELVNLTTLSLNGNELTGTVPKEIAKLSTLQSMQLQGNQLSGEIPEKLTTLERLKLVRLSGNQFLGCLPPQLLQIEVHDLRKLTIPTCSVVPEAQSTPNPPISEICFDDSVIPKMMQRGEVAGEGFTSDCRTLLQAKASMPPSCDLNWGADTPFLEWDGVYFRLGTPPFYQNSKVMGLGLPWECVSNGLPKVLEGLRGDRLIAVGRTSGEPFDDIPSDWVAQVDSGEIVAEQLKEFGFDCVRVVGYKVTNIDYSVAVVSGCATPE